MHKGFEWGTRMRSWQYDSRGRRRSRLQQPSCGPVAEDASYRAVASETQRAAILQRRHLLAPCPLYPVWHAGTFNNVVTCAANVGTKSARHFGEVMQTILAPTEHAIGQNGEGIGPRQQVSAPVRKRMANLVPWPRQEGAQFASPLGGFRLRPSQEGFSLQGEKPDLGGSFWVLSGSDRAKSL